MFPMYKSKYSDKDHDKYAPEYRRAENIIYGALLVCIILLCAVVNFRFGSLLTPILFVICAMLCLVGYFQQHLKEEAIDLRKSDEQSALHANVKQLEDQLAMTTQQIDDLKNRGHSVLAGAGATVIINSKVVNSFNRAAENDPELKNLMEMISGLVEKSGNKDAGATWSRFIEEVGGNKDKVVLRALWDNTVKYLPDVAKIVDGASKITDLFV